MMAARFNTNGTGRVIVGRRYFNVAQAERAIVLVKRIIADVVSWYDRLLDLQETMEAAQSSDEAGQLSESTKSKVARTAERLHSCLLELDDVGVELEDWETGVVDFPCVAGGREVRLCWQYGDKRIKYWHDIHGCPGGRKSIETLPVADRLGAPVS